MIAFMITSVRDKRRSSNKKHNTREKLNKANLTNVLRRNNEQPEFISSYHKNALQSVADFTLQNNLAAVAVIVLVQTVRCYYYCQVVHGYNIIRVDAVKSL